jgi:hypothetical protein
MMITFEQKLPAGRPNLGRIVNSDDFRMEKEAHMKKILSFALLASLSGLTALSAEKTWTGRISDSMCGSDHTAMTKEHQKEGQVPGSTARSDKDRECTLACVKSGGKYVFVTGGKVYEIENQDLAGLQQHAGHSVKLTGEMDADGKTIKVSRVTMAAATDAQK